MSATNCNICWYCSCDKCKVFIQSSLAKSLVGSINGESNDDVATLDDNASRSVIDDLSFSDTDTLSIDVSILSESDTDEWRVYGECRRTNDG